MKDITCPACGYTPRQECDENSPMDSRNDMPKTYAEQLDFFEVSGADDGNVFCPKCSLEFPVSTGPGPPRQKELF